MQKYALRKANAIITDSNSSKRDILKYIGVSGDNVKVVYLAAGENFRRLKSNQSETELIQKKYNLPEKFVLYVGDVTWNKNLPRLIDAVKQINIPLVMVGKSLVSEDFDKNNPWNADLLKMQEKSNKDDNIIRLGFIDEMELVQVYNLATVFIMPSLYEGFGLPILEAMACGCPVITTKEGSLEEVAGDAAFYVDGYDVESISSGIKKVFSDEALQKELSIKGLIIAEKFSWKNTALETAKVYKEVLSK